MKTLFVFLAVLFNTLYIDSCRAETSSPRLSRIVVIVQAGKEAAVAALLKAWDGVNILRQQSEAVLIEADPKRVSEISKIKGVMEVEPDVQFKVKGGSWKGQLAILLSAVGYELYSKSSAQATDRDVKVLDELVGPDLAQKARETYSSLVK